jgi:hypothetical protein
VARVLCSLLAVFLPACGDDDDEAPVDAAVEAGSDAGADAAADGGDAGDPGDPCLGSPGADLVTVAPLLQGLPGAIALGSDGTTAVVCGAGFVQAVDLAGGRAGQALVTDSPCRGASVDGARAAITTAAGDVILYAVGAEATLLEETRVAAGAEVRGLRFAGDVLLVAAGAEGVLRWDVAAGGLAALPAFGAATDARALADAGQGRLAVADGALGAALLDAATGEEVARLVLPSYEQILIDPDAEGGIRDVVLPFEADSIAASADLLFVGCGATGHVRATRDGDVLGEAVRSPTPFARPPGVEGVVRGVALRGDELLFVDGGALVRLGLGADGALEWIARERRPGHGTLGGAFWAAVEVAGDEVLALSTDGLYRAELAPKGPAATVDLGRDSLFVQAAGGDAPENVILQIGNFGDAALAVRLGGVEPAAVLSASFLGLPGQPGPDPDDPSCLRVPPGPNVGAVDVVFTPADDAPVTGTLTLDTNDPDAPRRQVPVRANPDVLTPGDPAPDFGLVSLDGELVRLSDFAGDVVLLKFFNYQ